VIVRGRYHVLFIVLPLTSSYYVQIEITFRHATRSVKRAHTIIIGLIVIIMSEVAVSDVGHVI